MAWLQIAALAILMFATARSEVTPTSAWGQTVERVHALCDTHADDDAPAQRRDHAQCCLFCGTCARVFPGQALPAVFGSAYAMPAHERAFTIFLSIDDAILRAQSGAVPNSARAPPTIA